jgi:hypothetical protein
VEDLRLVEEVLVKGLAGVEDLDADEAAVFPVEDDERFGASGVLALMLWRPGSSFSSVRQT